jgi:subtilase family serine protease
MSTFRKSLFGICLGSATVALGCIGSPVAYGDVYTQADVVGATPAKQVLHFDVYLPLRNADKLDALVAAQQDTKSPLYHKWLTPAQFGAQFGPSKATLAAVEKELKEKGLSTQVHTRSVHVIGTAAAIGKAMHAELSSVRGDDGAMHSAAMSGLQLSPAMKASGARVVAFNMHKIFFHVMSHRVAGPVRANRYGTVGPYWYNDLKQAYGYPAYNATIKVNGKSLPYNGTGVTMAALMSSDMSDGDVDAMFLHEHYNETTGKGAPLPAHHYVSGAVPNAHTGAYDEASLDVQQELGGAPGANVILYDIPDLSDASVMGGYTEIDEVNNVDIVSSSFGGCELVYTPAYNGGADFTYVARIQHELFVQGNTQGITFLASSGDEGGKVCPSPAYVLNGKNGAFIPSVSTPASDPNVTAVGGTNLVTKYTAGSLDSPYVKENAFSDPEIPYDIYALGATVSGGVWGPGGGVSAIFRRPGYQSGVITKAPIAMRMVPDIGMQVGGCPGGISELPCNGGDSPGNGNGNTDRSAVITVVDGSNAGLIGTSVASPEFASVMALLVERVGRMGNINPYLYSLRTKQLNALDAGGSSSNDFFHTNIPGFNGIRANMYPARGYNFTIGVGTPIVAKLIGAPAGTPLAGIPRTPSNP